MDRSAARVVLVAMVLGCSAALAAEPTGIVTILEGEATLIRGAAKYAAAPGVRVQADDLIETGKSTFARVEFPNQGIVDLGPSTRAQLNRPSLRRADHAGFYLLTGWLKITAGEMATGAKAAVASPVFEAFNLAGKTVMHVEGDGAAVFAEDGALRLVDRRQRAGAPLSIKSGDFVALHASEPVRTDRRPSKDFLAALPRPFEDTLPSLLAKYESHSVAPKPLGTFRYAEVEAWLDAEPMIRRGFVQEWMSKADEPAFRERLEVGLPRHPEWERVLYPERFEPKPHVAGSPSVSVDPARSGVVGSTPENPSESPGPRGAARGN